MTYATATFLAFAACAAACDLRQRRVPNRLNVAFALVGLVLSSAGGFAGVLSSAGGVAAGLVLLLPAFAVGWIGAGDVKLLAAMGAWLGPIGVAWAGLTGLALGGLLALLMAITAGIGSEVAFHVRTALMTRTAPVAPARRRGLIVPLAVPFVLAAAAVRLGGLP